MIVLATKSVSAEGLSMSAALSLNNRRGKGKSHSRVRNVPVVCYKPTGPIKGDNLSTFRALSRFATASRAAAIPPL